MAPFDKTRTKKVLTVPISKAVLGQALKALVDLHAIQYEQGIVNCMSPRKLPTLRTMVKNYGRRLQFDRLLTGIDRGAGCILRDGYSIAELTAMLMALWKGPLNPTERSTHIREHFALYCPK